MLHAFADPVPQRAPASAWSRGDLLLIGLCLPPLLLATWIGTVCHNLDRGAAAVRYSLAMGERPASPVFFVGSLAGGGVLVIVVLAGGGALLGELLSEPWTWVILLLPELAWAGPLSVAWLLMPLRGPMSRIVRVAGPPLDDGPEPMPPLASPPHAFQARQFPPR